MHPPTVVYACLAPRLITRGVSLPMDSFAFLAHAVRHIVFAIVFFAAGLAAWSQPDGPPPGGPPPGDMQSADNTPSANRELKRLTRALALTAEQQTQVKTILESQQQQTRALFDQARAAQQKDASGEPPSPEARKTLHAQVKAIRQDADTQIAALLSDTQKTKFAELRAQQAKREAQRGDDDMPPPPPDGEGPPPDGGSGGPPPGGAPPGI